MDFIKAHFANNERTVVKAYYQDDDKGEVQIIISAEEGNRRWEELKKLISIDDLHEATYKHIKEQQQDFEMAVMSIAKREGMLLDLEGANADSIKKLLNMVFIDEEEETKRKELLFTFKLALFEFEQIKNSDNKELKASLRKAPTILEVLKIAIQIIETV